MNKQDKEQQEYEEKRREEIEIARSAHKAFVKEQQEMKERLRQAAIKRREEGKSHPCDYIYFQDENKKDRIAHQDEKIAHPDSMDKSVATILLIVGMIGSLIFKQWYLIWILLFLWYFGTDRV